MRTAIIVRNTAIGTLSGIIASAAMNGFQAAWTAAQKRLGSEGDDEGGGDPSTVKAADRLTEAAAGEPVPEQYREASGQLVHYGFGSLLGGVYGAASSVLPKVTTGFGLPFGAATWASADEVAVPAAGLSEPPQKTPLSTHAYSLASHLLFGAVLEGSSREMSASADQVFGPQRQEA